MRIILIGILSVVTALLLGGCHPSRKLDLDTALRATQHGEYVLVVVTDQFVSFQNTKRKDQYDFTAPLSPEVIARIKGAVKQGSKPSLPIHFMDARANSRPDA